jgi:hypothetical protein
MFHVSTPYPCASLSNMAMYIRPERLAYHLWSESWIEVASQPSSSSLSSIADEIVTDGLRVQHDSNTRRRRRRRATIDPHGRPNAPTQGGSSQEEYEESESESDRIMTSSSEGLQPSPMTEDWRAPGERFMLSSASSDVANGSDAQEEDDDENATAIGVPRDDQCFTPQPNIFTQPPTARAQQHSATSYFAQRPTRPNAQRHSFTARDEHSPYNMISPSYQADHDAALRASLSTLLSCAAAARGLPKSNRAGTDSRTRAGPSNRLDTASIGIVPESAVYGSSNQRSTEAAPPTQNSTSRNHDAASNDKAKRKATTTSTTAPRSNSKDRRTVKKARRTSNWTPATMDEVSPTLLTWVVSAGVVVLVSALSFSAGYVVGKEAGRAEMLGEVGSGVKEAGRACGRDAIEGAGRGLRRLRLTDATSSIRV